LSSKELEGLAPDRDARTGAVNFLLSAGLLKLLKDNSGKLSFRAVVKKELDAYVLAFCVHSGY
jgi:DNA-directed RNA polymerase III subunit RPC6